MKYRISKIIPVHFATTVGRNVTDEKPKGTPTHVTWWQWRGRIWGYNALEV